jgi:hypothetical protein
LADSIPVKCTALRALSLSLVAFVGASACGDARDSADIGVSYDTIAGVEHVISTGRGAWTDEEGTWSLDETGVVAIGAVDGPDEYVFGQISGVVVDGERRIHVADPQALEIRVFSPEGEFLRRVGRDGEGPGEFRHISGLALAPDGIAALDGSLGRVTVFGLSGDVVRSFRLLRSYMILEHYAAMGFDPAGRFFDRARLSMTIGTDSVGAITYDPAGAVADTAILAVIPMDQVTIERNGVPMMSIPRPFAPRPSLAFGPEGNVYLARGGEYRIDVFSPAGDSLRAIRREVQAPAVGEAERDSALAVIADRFESAGQRMPPGIELPARKPVVSRLIVDVLGNLWVLHQPVAGADRFEWSVHDANGHFLGTVTTPLMVVTQIGEDFLAGTVQDELGVARAVVFPIVKGERLSRASGANPDEIVPSSP